MGNTETHVLSSSGKASSLESLLLYGKSTKLILTEGTAGTLLISKYSKSQNGMISSRTRASSPVLDTWPRYNGDHPEEDSSEIMIDVCGEMPTEGASPDVGGFSGLERSA